MPKIVQSEIYSSAQSLVARTIFSMDANTRLTLRTSKNQTTGRLETTASVEKYSGGGCWSHVIFGDYHERLEGPACPRATKRLIEEQHNRWVTQVDQIVERIQAHYAKATV